MGFGEKVESYIKQAAEAEAVRYEEDVHCIIQRCESPIEALLTSALYTHNKIGLENFHFMTMAKEVAKPYFYEAAFVYFQMPIGTYRADLLIVDASLPLELGEPRLMIVECDGHDYHERTKEQARKDKQRDRYFQGRGYKVLRFTGSEIWADPDACASEIADQLACNEHFRSRNR